MRRTFKPSNKVEIDGRVIGENEPVYFVAEIGSNFDGDLSRAKDLIHMAKESGADAVKFQHYTAGTLVSDLGFKQLDKNTSHQSLWDKSVYDTYEEASIDQNWTCVLEETCRNEGLSFFTSPYSLDLVDLVDEYVPAYKIGSGDITWIEIIERMSSKGKPVLLATGASDLADVKRAVEVILSMSSDLILLQCNTNYTASRDNYSYLQLKVLSEYKEMYPGVITGLSDHMPGYTSVLGAVALGAKVIEKHFTDSIDRTGPDHAFSMTPDAWCEMVDRTRDLEASLGDGQKRIEENEKETAVLQRRSVCAKRRLKKGDKIRENDLIMLRPCPMDGIEPYEVHNVIGKVLMTDIFSGGQIKWKDLVDREVD